MTAGTDTSAVDSSVTFKGSLLILSQCSSCGLRRETQRFCSPQQLTNAISGHKSDCQHLTHLFICTDTPMKEPQGRWTSLRAEQEVHCALCWNGRQTMMQSKGIPHHTKSVPLPCSLSSSAGQERSHFPPPLLPHISGLGAGVAYSINTWGHSERVRITAGWQIKIFNWLRVDKQFPYTSAF